MRTMMGPFRSVNLVSLLSSEVPSLETSALSLMLLEAQLRRLNFALDMMALDSL